MGLNVNFRDDLVYFFIDPLFSIHPDTFLSNAASDSIRFSPSFPHGLSSVFAVLEQDQFPKAYIGARISINRVLSVAYKTKFIDDILHQPLEVNQVRTESINSQQDLITWTLRCCSISFDPFVQTPGIMAFSICRGYIPHMLPLSMSHVPFITIEFEVPESSPIFITFADSSDLNNIQAMLNICLCNINGAEVRGFSVKMSQFPIPFIEADENVIKRALFNHNIRKIDLYLQRLGQDRCIMFWQIDFACYYIKIPHSLPYIGLGVSDKETDFIVNVQRITTLIDMENAEKLHSPFDISESHISKAAAQKSLKADISTKTESSACLYPTPTKQSCSSSLLAGESEPSKSQLHEAGNQILCFEWYFHGQDGAKFDFEPRASNKLNDLYAKYIQVGHYRFVLDWFDFRIISYDL